MKDSEERLQRGHASVVDPEEGPLAARRLLVFGSGLTALIR